MQGNGGNASACAEFESGQQRRSPAAIRISFIGSSKVSWSWVRQLPLRWPVKTTALASAAALTRQSYRGSTRIPTRKKPRSSTKKTQQTHTVLRPGRLKNQCRPGIYCVFVNAPCVIRTHDRLLRRQLKFLICHRLLALLAAQNSQTRSQNGTETTHHTQSLARHSDCLFPMPVRMNYPQWHEPRALSTCPTQ